MRLLRWLVRVAGIRVDEVDVVVIDGLDEDDCVHVQIGPKTGFAPKHCGSEANPS